MGLETPIVYISDLVVTNPLAGDPRSQGDDHLRGIKTALLGSVPGLDLRQLTGLDATDEGKVLIIDSAGLIEAASIGLTEEIDDSFALSTSWATLSFDLGSEVSDDHNLWDNANPTRFTMPESNQIFLATITGDYSSHTAGMDMIRVGFEINAGTRNIVVEVPIFEASGVIPKSTFFIKGLVVTDYVEISLILHQVDTTDVAVTLTNVTVSIRRFY